MQAPLNTALWSELCQLQAANMLLEKNLPKELAHLNKNMPMFRDTGAVHTCAKFPKSSEGVLGLGKHPASSCSELQGVHAAEK